MKRLIFLLMFLFWCGTAQAAEFLIKAQEPWNNSDVNAPLSRSRLGDIIVIRPDGWEWGKEECLPRFIIVKIPGITVEAAKMYEQSLYDVDGKLLKVRKYQVPSSYMSTAITAGNSVITITLSAQKTAFINSIVEKTQ